MTSQEVFDLIVEHLRAQKSRSIRTVRYWTRDEIEPALHGDEGKRCPAGLFIQEEEYDAKLMEGYSFGSFLAMKEAPQRMKDEFSEHAALIDACVFLHDFTEPERWEEELKSIASQFGLKLA